MFWNKQEEIIFDIILFILVIFQALTFFALKSDIEAPQYSLIITGFNLLFFLAMIPYAKWVWKSSSYQKAFLQLLKHETILLGLVAIGILLAMVFDSMKKHT